MRIQPTGFFGPDPERFSLRIRTERTLPSVSRYQAASPTVELARRLLDLREHVDGLRKASGSRRTSARSTESLRSPAAALSANALEVTTAGSPTTLQTSGLVASPTTLLGLVKSFDGASTSQAILDGAYDGSLGDQAELTFLVTKEGILGEDDTEVEVYDEAGTRLDELKIDKDDPNEVFTLSVGPEVRFSAGELLQDDTFTLDLSTSGGVVDPDQVFQGSGLPGGGLSFQTSFELASTATATLAGQYSGSFDDTLRFEVNKAGVVGVNDVEIEVFDGNDDKIDTLKFDKELAPGTALSLSNGLTLALSDGALLKEDQFELAVEADDQLVFSGGSEVQPGTLTINGTAIDVGELDTIRTLADRITASDAGVTASFDAATGQFQLTRNEDGPDAITLADDTGFLAAIGLAEGEQVQGTDAGTHGVTDLSELEGLSSGSFSINGEDVFVDVENDTIDDVLARINALEADVEATFVGNRLRLRSDEDFELQNGTSAFFDAVEIDTGLYEATDVDRKVRNPGVADDSGLKRSLNGVRQSLGMVFSMRSAARLPDFAKMLEQAIRGSFDVEDQNAYLLNSGLGLKFQLQGTTDVLSIDANVLDRVLSRKSHELRDFLAGRPGSEGQDGLVDNLSSALDQVLEQLAAQLDPIRDGGLLLDIRA